MPRAPPSDGGTPSCLARNSPAFRPSPARPVCFLAVCFGLRAGLRVPPERFFDLFGVRLYEAGLSQLTGQGARGRVLRLVESIHVMSTHLLHQTEARAQLRASLAAFGTPTATTIRG